MRSRTNLYDSTIPSACYTRFFAALHFLPRILGSLYGMSVIKENVLWADKQLPNHLGFTLEFHLPYYALRQHDSKLQDPRGLRRCGKFIPGRSASSLPECLYEAQISVVIVGVDEWVWTAYCCTENYFGSEETVQFYHERGLDAPSGGARPTHYPVWNPREYFLFILALRVNQITKEWSNTVIALEERLQYHVRDGPSSALVDC